jgi:hypothetical protein
MKKRVYKKNNYTTSVKTTAKKPGLKFNKVKTLLSKSLTINFPIKIFARRENCDRRA